MDSDSVESFFERMPPMTKFMLFSATVVSLGAFFKMLNFGWLMLDWIFIFKKFHLWRLFTDYFILGKFGIGWIFRMYFFFSFSSKLESHPSFEVRLVGKGGYLFFLVLQMLALDLVSLAFYAPTGRPGLFDALSFAICYYWSKKEPFATVSIWGFSLLAWQAPYAYFLLDFFMGMSVIPALMGITTAHFYHIVRDVLPVERNIRLLSRTPAIFGTLADKLDFLHPSTFLYSSGSGAPNAFRSDGARIETLYGGSASSSASTGPAFPGRGYRLGHIDTTLRQHSPNQ